MTTDLTPRTARQRQLREMSTRGGEACIEWQFCTSRGYGWLNWSRKKNGPAHRLAYLFENGHLAAALDVMHLCNNKACVNLNHLQAGSRSQNLQAAFDDGLHPVRRGEQINTAKLTEDDVRELRTSTERGVDAAKRLGVGRALITKIRLYQIWKHVP